MAADLGLISLTQPQKVAHQHPDPCSTPGSWTWNRRRVDDGDDSWEVRAFAEDTGSIMGTTWPPRSYTCSFCRREFRSAQALGGHMNVHRLDRARLRQLPPMSISPLIFPTQESISSAGLCLRYPFSAPTSLFTPPAAAAKGCMESPSTLLTISPYKTNNMKSSSVPSLPTTTNTDASLCNLNKIETLVQDDKNDNDDDNDNEDDESAIEELDLELRLGQKPLAH